MKYLKLRVASHLQKFRKIQRLRISGFIDYDILWEFSMLIY